MPRPKLRTPALREAILAAARALLEADGLAACTTRRIAQAARTSPPALYELFGDKTALMRAVVFEGFADLTARLDQPPSGDPRADLARLAVGIRAFTRAHPALSASMFARPVSTLATSCDQAATAAGLRRLILDHVLRWRAAEGLTCDPVDFAHGLLGLVLGLAVQERAGWLGTTLESRTRRWTVSIDTYLDGARAHREAPA